MKQRKPKVARELRELLSDSDFSEFTMIALRDRYESQYGLGECSSSSELRRKIYRRILPLVKRGYITKTDQGDKSFCVYHVTEQFKRDFQTSYSSNNSLSQTESVTGPQDLSQINSLKLKLNQYQVDMLACAGECKEYQQLASDYPHLREEIEPMYRNARERSSELMGQLRAIKNLLKQTGLTE